MAIRVKHAPSAAAIGESAYTIGRGEKMRWATDVALKQQALGIQRTSVSLREKTRAGQLALQYEQLESREEQQQDELEFRKQQYEDEPARQLEKGLQQQKVLREQEVWEYTESQKRRRAQVIEGLNWLQQRDDWTPEQKEDAARQLWGVFHKVIPGPVDAGPGIQQRFKSGWVTDETTGERWREQPDGKFEKEGMTREQFDKSYDSSFKTLTIDGLPPTPDEVLKHMDMKAEAHARFQQRANQTQEEKKRLQQKVVQDLKAMEEQAAIKKQAVMERDVASLPRVFEEFVEEPKIGRKIRRKEGWLWDKVFGEEAYNEILLKTTDKYPDIPPEVIKAELEKWWLGKFEEEKGQRRQKYQDPAKFKGAAQETPEGLGDIPQPKTKAEHDKLKPGTRYIDPDGVERIKR